MYIQQKLTTKGNALFA